MQGDDIGKLRKVIEKINLNVFNQSERDKESIRQ
jgi:hypothetical protein